VALDSAATHALVVLQLAPCSPKSIPQRHVRILVGLIARTRPLDGKVGIRSRNLNLDIEQVTLLMMLMGRLHNDVASRDMGAKRSNRAASVRMRSWSAGDASK
jgi:hypothetical protein